MKRRDDMARWSMSRERALGLIMRRILIAASIIVAIGVGAWMLVSRACHDDGSRARMERLDGFCFRTAGEMQTLARQLGEPADRVEVSAIRAIAPELANAVELCATQRPGIDWRQRRDECYARGDTACLQAWVTESVALMGSR